MADNRMLMLMKSLPTSNYNDSLIAYYPFNANTNDLSGNLHNGTATNITYTTGKISSSASFNGASSLVTVPYSSDFNFTNGINDIPFSISVWLYVSNTSLRYVIGKGNTTANLEFDISINPKLALGLYSNSANSGLVKTLTSAHVLNTWEHFVITYDGTSVIGGIKMYRNGVLDTGINVSYGGIAYTKMTPKTDNVILGRRSFAASGYYLGRQDEFYIWKDRVLTDSEALDIYTKGNSGQTLI